MNSVFIENTPNSRSVFTENNTPGLVTHLNSESNPVFALIEGQHWAAALRQAKNNNAWVMENFKIPGFYDNAHAPKVNALHLACARDAPPAVIIKLAALIPAATSKVDSKYKRTALHIAVLTAASCKTVKALILINPEAARTTDVFGRLPIHYACKEEKNGAANTRLLLNEFPLSTQVSDSNGFVPLHVACHAGASIGLVRNLLRADPTAAKIKTKRGATAVSCAKQSKGTQAEEILCVLQRL